MLKNKGRIISVIILLKLSKPPVAPLNDLHATPEMKATTILKGLVLENNPNKKNGMRDHQQSHITNLTILSLQWTFGRDLRF